MTRATRLTSRRARDENHRDEVGVTAVRSATGDSSQPFVDTCRHWQNREEFPPFSRNDLFLSLSLSLSHEISRAITSYTSLSSTATLRFDDGRRRHARRSIAEIFDAAHHRGRDSSVRAIDSFNVQRFLSRQKCAFFEVERGYFSRWERINKRALYIDMIS